MASLKADLSPRYHHAYHVAFFGSVSPRSLFSLGPCSYSGSAVGTVPTAAISGFTSSVKEAVPAKASVIGDPEIAAATKLEPLEKTAVGENLATGESTGPDDRTSKVLDELNEQAKQSTGVAGETLSQASGEFSLWPYRGESNIGGSKGRYRSRRWDMKKDSRRGQRVTGILRRTSRVMCSRRHDRRVLENVW